ncbi:CRISPR-associated protein, Cmr4 family [Prosthecobacter debontii]|uniref:CRISPR-associated protein, Cmr4 family n=1 Tax=Prosthecobacter debontii TaxID=48467 RepID=A0A1T4YIN8_9BACT|nr:type III-B CRISPR module RAMP protein Cmr4 [Prosthecobacter debontii]SKB01674.1 CRISPR-associated protein, Cmr4 family [Prosthecobacter debontii]
MTQHPLYLFTRTPLHVGSGDSMGAIDQPIQRERHTRHPIIPGSSIKGVLRDHFDRNPETKASVIELFGRGDEEDKKEPSNGGDKKPKFEAGKISFGEAQLILFPVRSAKGSFALATSVLSLSRLKRDAKLTLTLPAEPADNQCLAGEKLVITRGSEKGVVLEEYRFAVDGAFPAEWETHLSSLLDDAVLQGARGRFVLLSDGDFSHYAENACQVSQHVRINDETGTAADGGLFNEETVPSEALFVSALTEVRQIKNGNPVFDQLRQEQLIQFGGKGTTGLGFCTVKLA